jgi:hypothetical protein
MKTKIFSITGMIALLFTCQTIQAQLKYGLHAGLNLETQAELGELWNNSDLYQGFMAGGFLEYNAGKTISLQTEFNYQKKGGKFTSISEGAESVVRREFDYLTVPFLVKGNLHDKGLSENWDLSLFAGPYLGFLTSAHTNIKTGNGTSSADIDNQAEKTDLGAVFGGGVSYKLNSGGAIIAELRYQMGLNKIDKLDPDLRNKGMGLTIGYRF